MQPETWKPPIATSTPLARNCLAIAMARGYWLDWTPTRQTRPECPGCLMRAAILSIGTRMFISS